MFKKIDLEVEGQDEQRPRVLFTQLFLIILCVARRAAELSPGLMMESPDPLVS